MHALNHVSGRAWVCLRSASFDRYALIARFRRMILIPLPCAAGADQCARGG